VKTEAPAQLAELQQTWSRPRSFLGWVSDTSHRSIGLRYLATAGIFFLLAGLAALVLRVQLARPEQTLVSPERYDQLFTTHGATMMFLFAVPAMEGLALYLVPLMIGTRELSFPRLNAFGYWCYLLGGIALWLSVVLHTAPDAGWFNYPPLSAARFSSGANIDVYTTAVPLVELAAVVTAIELTVTILTHRAPGMSLNRTPLFVWATLVMAAMIIVAMPPLMVACFLLFADRNAGTHFFDPSGGGDPLLWQHLFWFFGHPEVYLMLLPGLGAISTIVSTFARRPTAGYPFVAASFVMIGAISFAVWMHHMFATDDSIETLTGFSAATMSVVVPSGVQVFSIVATLRHGRLRMSVPLLYALAFVFVFVAGGLTGVQIASVPFDWQLHDSYFIVAHFHYVLLGGVVLPLLGAISYWFPKFSGRLLGSGLGVAAFALIFVGVNATFFPMHLAGLAGMPRRVATYPAGVGWEDYQLASTIGAFILAAGFGCFCVNVVISLRRGRPTTRNPWDAGTLEWATASPPPDYAFPATPVVRSAYPLWDASGAIAPVELRPGLVSADRRETLATTIVEAEPEQRPVVPGPTLLPVTAAACLALGLLGSIFDPLYLIVGLVLLTVACLRWAAPSPEEWDMAEVRRGPSELPTGWIASSLGLRSHVHYGMLGLYAAHGSFFAALCSSYLYLVATNHAWPLDELPPRPLLLPGVVAALLLAVGAATLAARRAIRHDRGRACAVRLAAAALLTGVALLLLAVDAGRLDDNWATNATSSIEWALELTWGLSAAAFVVAAAAVAVYSWRGFFTSERFDGVTACTGYGLYLLVLFVPTALAVFGGRRWL
jgi:cytochrome c oxidase subunit I+III